MLGERKALKRKKKEKERKRRKKKSKKTVNSFFDVDAKEHLEKSLQKHIYDFGACASC